MKIKLLKLVICLVLISLPRIGITNSYFTDSETVAHNSIGAGTWEDTSPKPGDVVINEVYYDVANDGSKGTEHKNEWIELYNNTDRDISLKNWQLEDGQGNSKTIHPEATISAKGFAILSHDNSTWSLHWSIPADTVKINWNGCCAWLNNGGDKLTLKNAAGTEMDFVAWENFVSGWNLVANEGQSIARKVKGVDTDSPADWEVLSLPNPGTNPHPPPTPTPPPQPSVNFFLRDDKQAIGFSVSNVAVYETLAYEITYNTDTGNKGITGEVPVAGQNNVNRDDLLLGTCSETEGKACVYDTGITTIHLQITLKASGEEKTLEQNIAF